MASFLYHSPEGSFIYKLDRMSPRGGGSSGSPGRRRGGADEQTKWGPRVWFWKLITAAVVRGKTDYVKADRLNSLLPVVRSPADNAVREQAREKLETFAKLSAGASVPAIAALFALAEVLDKTDRPALQQAAYCFVVMGLAGLAAWLLSIAEPLLRNQLWGRLTPPDDPVYPEDEWRYQEAVEERLSSAPYCVRSAMKWQMVRWLKVSALACCAAGFCIGLLMAVGSLA